MKRYKNSSSPEPKKLVRWKLKSGITLGYGGITGRDYRGDT